MKVKHDHVDVIFYADVMNFSLVNENDNGMCPDE